MGQSHMQFIHTNVGNFIHWELLLDITLLLTVSSTTQSLCLLFLLKTLLAFTWSQSGTMSSLKSRQTMSFFLQLLKLLSSLVCVTVVVCMYTLSYDTSIGLVVSRKLQRSWLHRLLYRFYRWLPRK